MAAAWGWHRIRGTAAPWLTGASGGPRGGRAMGHAGEELRRTSFQRPRSDKRR
jgi:hypothetical protein